MKKPRLSMTFPRLFVLLLALSLCMSALALPTAAATPDTAGENAPTYATFRYDRTTEEVTAEFTVNEELSAPCTKVYRHYDGNNGSRMYSLPTGQMVEYQNKLVVEDLAETIEYTVYTEIYAGEMLILENDDYVIILFTQEGIDNIEKTLRQTEKLDIHKGFYQDDVGALKVFAVEDELVDAFDSFSPADQNAEKLRPGLMRFAPAYHIVGYENGNTWTGQLIGTVYRLDNEYYYVDISSLSNTYLSEEWTGLNFDVEEDLTFYRLTGEDEQRFKRAVSNSSYNYPRYIMEEDLEAAKPADAIPLVVIFGILPAIAPLAVGLCKYHSPKQNSKRRWQLLAILGVAWLICGILLTVLLAVGT